MNIATLPQTEIDSALERPSASAVRVEKLSYSYGAKKALDEVSIHVRESEIFGLLGPNGGGKTTLFRILSTLIPIPKQKAFIFGQDLGAHLMEIRQKMGVIFQAPSLDKKLTVIENLRHQGHLYGLKGETLRARTDILLKQVGLEERRYERVEHLSGGLQRRIELAKAFLHQPRLLLLDEPSTGLDPGARKDLWDYLAILKKEHGVTILVTTHLMDEADRCDRLGILDHGKIIVEDTPEALRARIGKEMIVVRGKQPESLCKAINVRFSLKARSFDDGTVRIDQPSSHQLIHQLLEAFPTQIDAVTLGRPTLEDVFMELTGHRFWNDRKNEELS